MILLSCSSRDLSEHKYRRRGNSLAESNVYAHMTVDGRRGSEDKRERPLWCIIVSF